MMKEIKFKKYIEHIAFFCAIFLLTIPLPAFAENKGNEGNELYLDLEKAFDQSIQFQQEKLDSLKDDFQSAQESETQVGEIYKNVTAQIATYRNLMLLPSVTLNDLKVASTEESVLLGKVQNAVAGLSEKQAQLEKIRNEIKDSQVVSEKKLSDMINKTIDPNRRRHLQDQIRQVMKLFNDQEQVIAQFEDLLADRMKRLKGIESDINTMAGNFNAKMEERIRGQTFHRNPSPVIRIARGEYRQGISEIINVVKQFVSLKFWAPPVGIGAGSYASYIFSLLLILSIAEAGLIFAGRQFRPLKRKCFEKANIWQYTALCLIERSLPYFGALAFLYFFPVQVDYRLTSIFLFFPLFIRLLSIWLIFLWGITVIRVFAKISQETVKPELISHLKKLIIGILVFGMIYAVLGWIISYDNIILILIRLGFEAAFFAWAVILIRMIRSGQMSAPARAHLAKPTMTILIYVIVSGFIIFELAGYSGLAFYWYDSWIRTAVIFFWMFLFFKVLKEADVSKSPEQAEPEADGPEEKPYPVRWALIRFIRLSLALALFILMPIAWGAQISYISELFDALNYQISIGSIQFNSIGIVYAAAFLFIIHILSVVLKSLMKNRLLTDIKMETGLKDSIIRITAYTIWGIGLIIVLRLIGISASSLTVVFGAVGIGIGFGLQNMFNNFFSGLILLFERPIQVGDVIEVEGVWGVVKEINVRATHVKTYDNADMMIPNSEIIGQRVINWSFRDPKVRRTVAIGVAYGSDVKLVSDTLLNIATKDSRVARRPHPDVLFADFGDSALIFKLRFWAHVDYFLKVETDIRFEIEKEFRRLSIDIPFPQRDVHIRETKAIESLRLSPAAQSEANNAL